MKIIEEVVAVKLRGSFTRPLDSSTRTSCPNSQTSSEQLESILNWVELSSNNQKSMLI